jgi:hypothetical protein
MIGCSQIILDSSALKTNESSAVTVKVAQQPQLRVLRPFRLWVASSSIVDVQAVVFEVDSQLQHALRLCLPCHSAVRNPTRRPLTQGSGPAQAYDEQSSSCPHEVGCLHPKQELDVDAFLHFLLIPMLHHPSGAFDHDGTESVLPMQTVTPSNASISAQGPTNVSLPTVL